MIYLIQNDREYDYDVRAIALAFYERTKIVEVTKEEFEEQEWEKDDLLLTLVYTKKRIQGWLKGKVGIEGTEERAVSEEVVCDYEDHKGSRNAVCRFLYRLFEKYTGRSLPWGMLTGIRPTKIIMKWMEEEKDSAKLEQRFRETYLADPQKANLCRRVAQREKVLLESRPFEKEYSLYIGIPFCPTTCLYCSFTSFPVSRFGDRMRAYLDALYKELAFVAKHHRDKKLTTIYIGGGTPTALDEECLSKLMNMIHELFPVEESEEFTVESGRPDSITKEKFRILKEAGVTRISINPQTMHQETLDLIGRAHTVEQTKEAFLLARKCGFDNINMDIITGLPGESLSYVHETLDEIFKLRPESLTVHSLAIKRAAHLNIEMEKYQGMVKRSTNEMLRLVDEYASNMGMEAYYMYRQKNIPGNLENIGYCVPDKECLYNILIMEEKQDIISCGAGASSKYVFEQGRIERTENVKNLDHYTMAFDYDGTHDLETSLQDSFGEAILHGVVVSNLASFVAREMALPEEQCHNLAIAGMLHDIGKLRLRSYVYEEKEAKLNIDELRYVRLHPSLGYAILKEHGYTKEILTAVLYHHENADGSGYPNNLKGEEIPLGARILRVCDAFGALIANRPYRSAFDIETAISIMIEEVKNFDMRVFLTFQKVTQSEDMKNMLTRLGIS